MSRAFVAESDAQFQDEEVPEIKIPLPPGAANYVTPEGAERLRAELAGLTAEERPRVASAVARLAAPGPATDRDELSVQRRRLRELERRIEYLQRMLARIEVVDPRQQSGDRVLFGATVRVREPGGREAAYRIVGVDEADPPAGKVSWISPLARALAGRRAGEGAVLRLPDGERRLEILSVEFK